MNRKASFSASRTAALVALSAAFLSVSAIISVPFFVPFTLQTFAIYLIIYIFGARVGLAATVTYIALGLVGLPIFAGFSGGIGSLFLPSGGFISGFALAALAYLALTYIPGLRTRVVLPTALSLFILYLSGAVHLFLFYTDRTPSSVLATLGAYVLPYIPLDVVKVALAAFLASKLKKHIKI